MKYNLEEKKVQKQIQDLQTQMSRYRRKYLDLDVYLIVLKHALASMYEIRQDSYKKSFTRLKRVVSSLRESDSHRR